MNPEHVEKVKERIKSLYNETDEEIVSVSYGYKQISSSYTEEKSIRFGVARKKPLSEIPPEKLIPKTILIDGVEYKTDVIEVKPIYTVRTLDKAYPMTDYPYEISDLSNNNPFTFPDEICTRWKLVTDVPGSRISDLVVHNICGNRTSSANFIDQSVFCLDNGATPAAGPGYSWVALAQSCYSVYPCNDLTSSPPPSPIADHRQNVRPLVGGVSMICKLPVGEASAGTLGGIVIDSTDGKMVGITNAHVSGTPGFLDPVNNARVLFFAGDPFLEQDGPAGGSSSNNYQYFNNIDNTQPGNLDVAGYSHIEANVIGKTKRIYPMLCNDFNPIDCAIVNLTSSVVSTDSWKQLNIDLPSPPTFATTAEIDALTTNTPILTCGRTSGPRGSIISQSAYYSGYYSPTGTTYDFAQVHSGTCCLSVTDLTFAGSVSGYGTVGGGLVFADAIRIEAKYPCNIRPAIGGDSGSMVFAYINGEWKIIGLIYAGTDTFGLVSRIDHIARLLKVEPYLGTAVDADPNTPTDINLDVATYGLEVSASIDGKIYWQIGNSD